MVFVQKKSKKYASAVHSFSVPSLIGENPAYYILGQTESGRFLFCVVIQLSDDRGLSGVRSPDDAQRATAIQSAEKELNKARIPQTDSLEELARFWDTHDLTDLQNFQ